MAIYKDSLGRNPRKGKTAKTWPRLSLPRRSRTPAASDTTTILPAARAGRTGWLTGIRQQRSPEDRETLRLERVRTRAQETHDRRARGSHLGKLHVLGTAVTALGVMATDHWGNLTGQDLPGPEIDGFGGYVGPNTVVAALTVPLALLATHWIEQPRQSRLLSALTGLMVGGAVGLLGDAHLLRAAVTGLASALLSVWPTKEQFEWGTNTRTGEGEYFALDTGAARWIRAW